MVDCAGVDDGGAAGEADALVPTGSGGGATAPVLLANHTDTLLRATLDGAGITSVAVDVVAPYLSRGELVRVLSPWITGRLAMYAALPSRKFIPQRTRAFVDYLVEQTREQTSRALAACESCESPALAARRLLG